MLFIQWTNSSANPAGFGRSLGVRAGRSWALGQGPAGVGIVRAGGGAVNVGLECLLVQLNAGRDVLAVDGDLIVAEVARHGHVFASADGDQVK